MATIEKKILKDGKITYRVQVRKKGLEISKSFIDEEDAKIYAFYKERLIDNMGNFEIPIQNRLTFRQLFDLKLDTVPLSEVKAISDLCVARDKFSQVINIDKFLYDISYEEWLKCAKDIFKLPVYKGTKAEHNKRDMAPKTLRRVLATASSIFSHAISLGIPIENHILKVIQVYVNPMIKKSEE